MSVDLGYFTVNSTKMSNNGNDEKELVSEEKNDTSVIVQKNESPKKNIIFDLILPSVIEKLFTTYWGLSIFFGSVSFLTILVIAADECRQCFKNETFPLLKKNTGDQIENFNNKFSERKIFRIYYNGKNIIDNDHRGHLTEVFTILERIGYKFEPNPNRTNNWDLFWAHDYPFRALQLELKNLKPYQKINHFPGCGFITNKVDLAISNLPFIPSAFKLPQDKEKLLAYSKRFPNKIFVQKNNDHRNIQVKKLSFMDLEKSGTFVQEFIDRPLLIGGHKFDIGIYVIITSIDPLRVYIYNGEALLRFCPAKYYPFDSKNFDKYVVGDDYLPIWEVPELDDYYNNLGFGMRESLNAFLRSEGKNPNFIWSQIEESIRIIMLEKEPLIANILNNYKFKRNFFEMMRFDFVVDENLNVYLLEANMSPNLSSSHFPPNKLIYQQLLYNLFGLVGVGERIFKNTLEFRSSSEEEMLVSDKHLVTYPEKCHSKLCKISCVSSECQLCKSCLSPETRRYLIEAFKEHLHRGDCKRIFPPIETQEEALKSVNETYSAENKLHYRWFKGKCLLDKIWC